MGEWQVICVECLDVSVGITERLHSMVKIRTDEKRGLLLPVLCP